MIARRYTYRHRTWRVASATRAGPRRGSPCGGNAKTLARAVSQQSESRGDSPIAFVVIERSRLRRQSRFEIAVNFESVRGQNVDDAMRAA